MTHPAFRPIRIVKTKTWNDVLTTDQKIELLRLKLERNLDRQRDLTAEMQDRLAERERRARHRRLGLR